MSSQHTIRTLVDAGRFALVEHRLERPGRSAATVYALAHPGSVVILPWIDSQRICLIRNYRLTVDSWVVELPAGTREPDESPIETAARELIEETGYRAGTLESLYEVLATPGTSDERMHAFVATDLQPGPPAREANEQIENLVVPFNEALDMVDRGEIVDAKTRLALLTCARRRQTAGS